MLHRVYRRDLTHLRSDFVTHTELHFHPHIYLGTVEGVVDAIWYNQGQVCCAGSRILVQESVAPQLIAKLKARMMNLRVGHSLDKCVDMGPMADPLQVRVRERE